MLSASARGFSPLIGALDMTPYQVLDCLLGLGEVLQGRAVVDEGAARLVLHTPAAKKGFTTCVDSTRHAEGLRVSYASHASF